MCGICGVISADGRTDLGGIADRMCAAMIHRGPDAAGELVDPGVALGMRRLSIIDRANGLQPQFNEARSIAVICNGEIYNFRELREELEQKGYRFRTRSDTEAIVHAYEEWGDQALPRLRGMFALAIYDRREAGRGPGPGPGPGSGPGLGQPAGRGRRVLLARDRIGIKPLYYARVDGVLLFASEVRALLASGIVARRLSPAGLESYLLFGSVSEPDTVIDGVRSLPPGHAWSVSVPLAERESERERGGMPQPYWTLRPRCHGAGMRSSNGAPASASPSAAASASASALASAPAPAAAPAAASATATASASAPAHASASASASSSQAHTNSAAAQALRALLDDSVRAHLISDEPLGVFLSGGVDSTTVAAIASRVRSGVQCYTVRVRDPEFDESAIARRTARQLGVEHCELLIEAEDMLGGMDAAICALDQPSVDGINTYCVSAAVRRAGAKVALSGLGGDELFGGYRTFRWMPPLGRLSFLARRTPSPLRRAGAHAIATAGAWIGRTEDTDRLASIWRDPDALPHPFFFARTIFGPRDVDRLLPPRARNGQPDAWRAWIDDATDAVTELGLDPFTAVSYLELRSYMLNTLLRDADAMSMAHSLELRVPLLDHTIVEFVAGQPDAVKRRAGAYKPLLVDALGDLMPAEVACHPKRGFTLPWKQWTRGPLAPRLASQLQDLAPPLAACLRQDEVAATWQAFRAGRCGWLRPWSLYVLNEWVAHHL